MGTLLLLIAVISTLLLLPIALTSAAIYCRNWDNYFGGLARVTDIFCNVLFQFALNRFLIYDNCPHKFGTPGEYISGVLADAYKNHPASLKQFGHKICLFLIRENDPAFK